MGAAEVLGFTHNQTEGQAAKEWLGTSGTDLGGAATKTAELRVWDQKLGTVPNTPTVLLGYQERPKDTFFNI